MMVNVFENKVENSTSFCLDVELKELTTNGIVDFSIKTNKQHSLWSGKLLTIPVYGVYKISWGFYQNSINTFYKEFNTELILNINNNAHVDNAFINKKTPSFHAIKASHKTITLLLRENDKIYLKAKLLNGNNPKMKDIYFKVEKLFVDGSNKFGYES